MSQAASSVDSTSPHTSLFEAHVGSPQGTPNGSSRSPGTSLSARKGGRKLTAAQLEKKRANDRDAQRNQRERTKHLIEAQEKRIQELENGEAYRQLQDVIREKEAVQAENAELRSRLASILDLLRPIFPNDPIHNGSTAASSSRSVTTGAREFSNITATYPPSSPGAGRHPLNFPHPSFSSNTTNTEVKSNISSNVSTPWDNQRIDPWERMPNHLQPWKQTETTSSERSHNPTSLPTPTSTRSESNPAFSTPSNYISNTNGSHAPPSTSYTREKPTGPHYALLPVNLAPTCDYDRIVNDFTTAGKRQLAAGRPLDSICGGSRPTLTGLTDYRSSKNSDDHYLSDLLIELLKGFSLIKGLPEKIAVVTNMFAYMRWIIQPTEDTYEAVPPYMRPVEEQLRIPHPIWVDYLPWPAMRLKLLYEYPWLPLERFFFPYCASLAISFPYGDVYNCLDRDPETDQMYVKPELYRTIRVLNSWSVGSEFASSFPALAESCRINDR